jgi:hypothetical protein
MTPLSKSGLNPVLLKIARRRREQEWKKEEKQIQKTLQSDQQAQLQQQQQPSLDPPLKRVENPQDSQFNNVRHPNLKKRTTGMTFAPPPQPQSRKPLKSRVDFVRDTYANSGK